MLMQKAQESAEQVGGASLVVSIVISLVANRALKHIFVFFVALQVIILFSLSSNYEPPASAKMFFDAILDIINLTAVKEIAAEQAEGQSDVLKAFAIGGMSIVGAPLLLLAILLYFCKNVRGKWIDKIRNYLYYKLLIQYFKVVFIALLLDNLFVVTQSSDRKAILKSTGTLTGVAAILLYFLAILTLRDRLYLEQNRP